MASSKQTVFSTDPEPTAAPKAEAAPRTLAAPFPTRQQNNPVRVHIERKGRGGKTVSVLKGVMSPPHGKQALVKLLKNKVGTGGAVKGQAIEIQGDHATRVSGELARQGFRVVTP